jgi:phosphoribosylanthranilate isomerase
MNLKLKVCGIRDSENILNVAKLGPDYMGFIFYPQSKRFVGENFLVPKEFPTSIKRVGVFVNENYSEMMRLVEKYRLDLVQLHGGESVAVCRQIRSQGIGVIKVFSVDGAFDMESTRAIENDVDFFLFDTKTSGHGGSGKVFDWQLLKKYNQRVPFFLSGGISAENISEVKFLSGMNIHAVDVNSGVESSPGMKDIEKIKLLATKISTL